MASMLLVCPAAAADRELAELTPGDAGIYLSMDGLAPAIDEFLIGPHFRRWRGYPPVAKWSANNRPAMERLVTEAARQVGVEAEAVWRDVLGHRLMLAAWPAESGEAQGPVLLLVQARNQATLDEFVAGVTEAQTRAGEVLRTETRRHAAVEYQARTLRRRGGEAPLFLATSGKLAVVTSHEHLIKQVLDLLADRTDARASLAASPEYQTARARAFPETALFAFVNARPWDAMMAADPAPDAQAAQQFMARAWRAIRCLSVSVRLSPQIELDARVAFQSRDENGALVRTIQRMERPTTALEWMPADCLAAVAGSVDLQGWLPRTPAPAAEKDQKKQLESDATAGASPATTDRTLAVFHQLLHRAFGGIGPSAGGYAIASENQQRTFTLDLVAGLEIGRHDEPPSEPLTPARGLESLRSLLLVAVSLLNLSHAPAMAEVETFRSHALELYSVSGLQNLPDGWFPTFTVARSTLLAGTSREAVERSARIERSDSLAESRLAEMIRHWPLKPDQLLYVDMQAARAWLSQNSAAVLSLTARDDEQSAARSPARERGLQQVIAALRLADTLVIAIDAEPTGVGLRAVLHIDPGAGASR